MNIGVTQNRTQENLLWALEQDQEQFLHYLDSLSKDAESRIGSILGLKPMSPVRDSDGLQIPKPGDNVGVHGVLSMDLASSDGEPLSGGVDYSSDVVFAIQEAVTVAPNKPLMENSGLHPPSSTQGDTVCFSTEDTESLTTGEHKK